MTDAPPRSLPQSPAVPEVDVLWLTAGLSCDGDSVSITAATQPWASRGPSRDSREPPLGRSFVRGQS